MPTKASPAAEVVDGCVRPHEPQMRTPSATVQNNSAKSVLFAHVGRHHLIIDRLPAFR